MSAVPEHDMYVNTHRHGLRLRLKLRLRFRLRLRAGAKAYALALALALARARDHAQAHGWTMCGPHIARSAGRRWNGGTIPQLLS